jgi:hypothetical protein
MVYMIFSHKYDLTSNINIIYIYTYIIDLPSYNRRFLTHPRVTCLPFVLQHRVVDTTDAGQLPENAVPCETCDTPIPRKNPPIAWHPNMWKSPIAWSQYVPIMWKSTIKLY